MTNSGEDLHDANSEDEISTVNDMKDNTGTALYHFADDDLKIAEVIIN